MNTCVISCGLPVVDMNKAKKVKKIKLWLQNIQIISTPGLDAYLSLTLQSSYMMSYVAV